MTIQEQIQILEDNLNEYGQCNITIEEYNYIKDELYSSGCLAGIELGRADAIKELFDLTEKAIKTHADKFIKFGNGAGRRNGRIMGMWLFEYFIEMKIEAEKILEQLKEQKEWEHT